MYVNSSVLVGERSSVFGNKIPESDEEEDIGNEEGTAVFSSSWLPGTNPKYGYWISHIFLFTFCFCNIISPCCWFFRDKQPEDLNKKRKKKRKMEQLEEIAMDEDVVEDLVLSSDEDEEEEEEGSLSDASSDGDDGNWKPVPQNQQKQKQKPSTNVSKKKKSRASKSRKRNRTSS